MSRDGQKKGFETQYYSRMTAWRPNCVKGVEEESNGKVDKACHFAATYLCFLSRFPETKRSILTIPCTTNEQGLQYAEHRATKLINTECIETSGEDTYEDANMGITEAMQTFSENAVDRVDTPSVPGESSIQGNVNKYAPVDNPGGKKNLTGNFLEKMLP